MRNTLTAVFAAIVLLASGCATPVNTPSGKPEITIKSTDKAAIKAAFINEFMTSGYGIDSESDNSISASKEMSSGEAIIYQTLLGNAYSSTPRYDIKVNMATIDGQTRVMAQAFARMKNAFGKEDINDMTSGKSGPVLISLLERVKQKVEKKATQ